MKDYGHITILGESVRATRDMRRLWDAGWRVYSDRRRGMFKTRLWYKVSEPHTECVSQAVALRMLRWEAKR